MNLYRRQWIVALALLTLVLGPAGYANAQTLTGQIGGTVTDSSKGVLPGVTVTAKNEATSSTQTTVTDANGAFVIPNVIAGRYTVTFTLNSFKTYEAKGVVVSATERVALAPVTMQVGGVNDSVTVVAEAAKIQTQSGERSATITAEQIEDIGLRGRDFMGTLKVLPGVIDSSNREAPGWGSVGNMSINGLTSFNFSYDGVTNKDTGSNSGNYAAPALDSIAEVKLQASNFQAEYGRTSGATIIVVTKSGTSKFRGSAAYFKRHEAFNANTWARRRDCSASPLVNANVPGTPGYIATRPTYAGDRNPNCDKAQYRYDNTAWTIGGPLLIPGTSFNENRDKLFFFWSQDLLPRKVPQGIRNSTMPTDAERRGDFSNTRNEAGQLRFIKDGRKSGTCSISTGGSGCFDNNIIPQELINPLGRLILNMYPRPNTVDPTGRNQYNFSYEPISDLLRTDQVARVDWNVRTGTTFYSRLQFGKEINARGYVNFLAGQSDWPQMQNSYDIDTISIVNTLIHSVNQSTVLEVTGGLNYSKQSVYPLTDADLQAVDRTQVLAVPGTIYANGMPQYFPTANPLNIIPNITLAGNNALPSTRSIGGFESRYPFHATNPTWDFTGNLTKMLGSHNMKAGVFVERVLRPAARQSTFNGSLSFNSGTNHALETNFGWANALLGVVNSYSESTTHPFAEGRFNQVEFFLQDNWRVNQKLTLDLGIRFVHNGATYVAGQQVAYFDPASYDRSKAPVLYTPVCVPPATTCTTTTRRAVDPRNPSVLLPNSLIGLIVPGSTDAGYSGVVTADGTPPQYDNKKFYPAPRVGFAYDLMGDGQTSIRGGFGVNYDRYQDDQILALIQTPPLLSTRSINNVTIDQVTSKSVTLIEGTFGPAAFAEYKPSKVLNWSVGVQRALPFRLTADVAYVGNTPRNISRTVAINDLSIAELNDPANLDPTNLNSSGQMVNRKATNFIRKYYGYGGINERRYYQEGVTYHSLQASVTRRTSVGLSGSVAYTKTRTYGLRSINPFLSEEANRERNSNGNGSRPHNLVISYNYMIPGLSRFLGNNLIAQGALDGWQISGVSTLQGGTRDGFSYTFTNQPSGLPDITGGFGDSRVVIVCNPNLPRSERTFDRQFRTECIRPPGPLSDPADTLYQGNSHDDEWITLGYINHDLTLFKNFALRGGRNLRIQVEAYNVFNTTQYSGVQTQAQFNWVTGVQERASFGQVTSVRNAARVIQLGARFTF